MCVRACARVRVPVTSGASSLELTTGVYIRPVTRLTQGAVCVSFSSGSPSWSSSTPACGTSSPWGRATRRPSPVSTPSHHLLSLTLRSLSLCLHPPPRHSSFLSCSPSGGQLLLYLCTSSGKNIAALLPHFFFYLFTFTCLFLGSFFKLEETLGGLISSSECF